MKSNDDSDNNDSDTSNDDDSSEHEHNSSSDEQHDDSTSSSDDSEHDTEGVGHDPLNCAGTRDRWEGQDESSDAPVSVFGGGLRG